MSVHHKSGNASASTIHVVLGQCFVDDICDAGFLYFEVSCFVVGTATLALIMHLQAPHVHISMQP